MNAYWYNAEPIATSGGKDHVLVSMLQVLEPAQAVRMVRPLVLVIYSERVPARRYGGPGMRLAPA